MPILKVEAEKDLARSELGDERRVDRDRKDGGGERVLREQRVFIRRGIAIIFQMRGSRDCESWQEACRV